MDYTKNAQRDLEVIGISACYCRKLERQGHIQSFFFKKIFHSHVRNMYLLWGFWGGRAGARTSCRGRKTPGMFVGLVPGLCLCSPAPSGTCQEGEGRWTHCSDACVPALPQGGQRCLSLPEGGEMPRRPGLPQPDSPSAKTLLGRRYWAKTSSLGPKSWIKSFPDYAASALALTTNTQGHPPVSCCCFLQLFLRHEDYLLLGRFISCLAEEK